MKAAAPPNHRLTVIRIAALLAVVAVTVFLISLGDQAERFAAYGYPGIFLVSLLANATVILPAPGLAVTFSMGAVFHPAGVAVAAASGATLGELSGYLAGFSGRSDQMPYQIGLHPSLQIVTQFIGILIAIGRILSHHLTNERGKLLRHLQCDFFQHLGLFHTMPIYFAERVATTKRHASRQGVIQRAAE